MTNAMVEGIAVELGIGFLVVMTPIMLLANKAIGKPWEREAEQMKAALAGAPLAHSEDGVPLRIAGIAPFSLSVRWRIADLRIDGRALYVMQYYRSWGTRVAQPNLRVTWTREPAVGGFLAAPIVGEPKLDGDAVVVPVELRHSSLWLRIRARDPLAVLNALNGMR